MKTAEKQSGATTKTTAQSANGKASTLKVVETTKNTPTVEKRLEALEQLQILSERRDRIKSGFDKLVKFNLGSEGTAVSLSFTSATGETFKTSNAFAFESVKETLVKVTQEALHKIDEEILTFSI